MQFDFRKEHLEEFLGRRGSEVDGWYDALVQILPKYEIVTKERVAMFLAQTGHESVMFKFMEENLNYSASRLRIVFGKYFGPGKRNENNYEYNPEKIANVVYANRIGNGGTRSGDGYRYRGRGIIQLTGKANYTDFANDIGISLEDSVEYLTTKKGAVEAACWYWDTRGLNRYADTKDVYTTTRLINGGTNGLSDRNKLYRKASRILESDDKKQSVGLPDDYRTYVSMGHRGEDVRYIQDRLGINSDGIFGPGTKRAVKKFQKENNLKPDGVVGPDTWEFLI